MAPFSNLLRFYRETLCSYNSTIPINNRKCEWFASVLFIVITILALPYVLMTGAYESVTVSSTDYNGSHSLWYEHITVAALRTPSRSCQPAIIELGQGSSLIYELTIEGLLTNPSGLMSWGLIDYLDEASQGNQVNGMQYANTALQDCSVVQTGIVQTAAGPLEDTVNAGCSPIGLSFRRG